MSNEEEPNQLVRQSLPTMNPLIRDRSSLRPVWRFNDFRTFSNTTIPDKLVLKFEHHRVSGCNHDDVVRFLEAIAWRRVNSRSDFNRPRGLSTTIRSGDGIFLSGSKIDFKLLRGGDYKMTIDICLNPTRYLAYGPDVPTSVGSFITLNRNRRLAIKRATLDYKDNYIDRSYETYRDFLRDDSGSTDGPSFLDLMDDVRRWFEDKINEYAVPNDLSIEYNWDNWSISQSEVYHEYYYPDAVALMSTLARYMPMVYKKPEFRIYADPPPGQPISVFQIQNSVSIHLKLGNGLRLVIYPKSQTVIRFELRKYTTLRSSLSHMQFDMNDVQLGALEEIDASPRTAREKATARATLRRNCVSAEFDGMARLLRIAGNHLATLIQQIVTVINENPIEGSSYFHLVPRFIRFLDDHIQNNQLVENVWSALAINGHIRCSNFPDISVNTFPWPAAGEYFTVDRDILTLSPMLRSALHPYRQDMVLGFLEEE